jgi:TRAP-type mannitol/chloroaromatic compound transport system permease large subunit
MDIYKGMFEYVGCQVFGIIVFMIFPALILWLPVYLGLWRL